MPRRAQERLQELSTAVLADACARLDVPVRSAPRSIKALRLDMKLAGRAVPVRHAGSVDVFLSAMRTTLPGDVLVVDNRGRTDEACIGDLIALEAKRSGLSGIVVWGAHRDTTQILAIGLPVFSCGSHPLGPKPNTARKQAELSARGVTLGDVHAHSDDVVVGDADGVILFPGNELDRVLPVAQEIARIENAQADAVRGGTSLREQLKFEEYLAQRSVQPDYTFRAHLRRIGGAIEV